MRLGDLKVGDKFRLPKGHPNYKYGRPYLLIDLNMSRMFSTAEFQKMLPTLDLTTYRVMCFNPEYEVEQDKDNIPV